MDFNALPVEALQKYKHHYNIALPDSPPPQKSKKNTGTSGKKRPHEGLEDEGSNSEDESPYRIDLGAWRPRVNKADLAKAARTHFNNLPPARENDVIVQFLYTVKTQGSFPASLGTLLTRLDKVLRLKGES
jgi:Sin3 binding region of histone deacetylase complex subunit SAP30